MSDSTSQRSNQLGAYAAATRQRVIEQLHMMMGVIDAEIAAAGGIYPGGKVTQAELCRRAGIRNATLQKSSHKHSTLREVKAWLERVGLKTTESARGAASDKVAELRRELAEVQQRYHENELELIEKSERLLEAQKHIAQLEAELTSLAARGKRNVTPIFRQMKSSDSPLE